MSTEAFVALEDNRVQQIRLRGPGSNIWVPTTASLRTGETVKSGKQQPPQPKKRRAARDSFPVLRTMAAADAFLVRRHGFNRQLRVIFHFQF